mgnify:CR=1 FL=1
MENKWFIKITEENIDILKQYWKTLVSKRVYKDFSFRGYLLSWTYDTTHLCYSNPSTMSGNEITIEEFLKDILGQNIESNYEIY